MINLEVERGKLNKDIATSKAIIYQSKAENRSLTDEEQSRIDELKTKIERRSYELDQEENKQNEQREVATGKIEKSVEIGPEYRKLFKTNMDSGGFRTFGEFLSTIESGRSDSRLQKLDTRQMDSTLGATGGFAVPVQFTAEIYDSALQAEIIRPRATVFPMISGERRVPCWDDLDRTGRQLYNGIQAQWTGELVARADQEPNLREVVLNADKLILYVSASREVIQDSVQLEQELMKAMRKAISYELDYSFLQGVGGGQPLGMLNSPSVLQVARAGAGAIVFADIVNMYSVLVKDGNGIWIASDTTLPQLMTMQSAGGDLIWQPNARDDVPGKLLGMPVYSTDKLPALGTQSDLILVQPSKYFIGMRQEISIDTSNSAGQGWFRDYTSWRIVLRAGGLCSWDQPMTTADGVTQMSPIVSLDA